MCFSCFFSATTFVSIRNHYYYPFRNLDTTENCTVVVGDGGDHIMMVIISCDDGQRSSVHQAHSFTLHFIPLNENLI